MNNKMVKAIAIIIIAAMIITSFSFVIMAPSLFGQNSYTAYGEEIATTDQELSEQMDYLEKYITFLKTTYKDKVDYQVMIDGAFAGATNSLGDKYTTYYETDQESASFIENVQGEFSGIGVVLDKNLLGATVISTILYSPSAKAGILAGDVIVKVDGLSMEGLAVEKISLKLRGMTGTKVVVTVKRGTHELSFPLTREKIKTSSVYGKILEDKIGYIQITSFDSDTDVEFQTSLKELMTQGATSFIIDVRNNGGGVIASAVGVANTLIKNGVIFNFTKQGEIVETTTAAGTAVYNLPTVLLVNENSASASEILAGAIQDNKVATVIGTTTFGKGIAQIIAHVGNGNQVKVSSFYFTTPDNGVINGKGIIPDMVVENALKKGTDVIARYESFVPMIESVKPGPGAVGLNVFGGQQRLEMLGYTVSVNGTMDANTVAAIKKFQADKGLASYGVLDYTTRDKLAQTTYNYVYGTGNGDKQLEKAIEVLKAS